MKKAYSKPLVKKLIKGAASDYKEFQEVHTVFIKHETYDVPDAMTAEEMKIHQQAFINKIPIHGGDKLQQLYDFDLKYLQARNPGYTEALYIKNLKRDLTEISLDRSNLHNQIRAEIFLQFLNEQNIDSDIPKTFTSRYNQLNTIRERLIEEKIIRAISEDNFVYLFTGQPIKKEMNRLEWKASHQLCHLFLSEVAYKGVNFSYKQVDECIKFLNGNKLNHTHKRPPGYKNKDILERILKF